MNDLEIGDRVVLPQWLSFSQACLLREHAVFPSRRESNVRWEPVSKDLHEGIRKFREAPQPFVASELMGLAVVMGEKELAAELAGFVVTKPIVGAVALSHANQILRPQGPDRIENRTHVGILKDQLRNNPHDAIAWIERARCYVVEGQTNKAKRAVLTALHLAPGNRHIVRAAIRYFVHTDDWDTSLRIAQRAYAINPDPLIFGPLLSIATHVDKMPKRIKPQVEDAMRSEDRLLNSEILGAAGALELIHGADQKSRKLFKGAWADPTRPVIGHSQWVLRERLTGLASEQGLDFKQSNQAMGWLRQVFLDFRGSLAACTEWSLEEPYSREAYILGSSSACLSGDFLSAENLAKTGLNMNPKDRVLINNLGFAQLHNGRITAAEETLKPLERQLGDETQVAPCATFGLLRMAQKRPEEGEKLYVQAIERAMKAKNRPLATQALLNYLYSTLTILKSLDVQLLSGATKILKNSSNVCCIGVADAIARKIQRSDLQGNDEASAAAKEFVQSVKSTKDAYIHNVRARFQSVDLQSMDLDNDLTSGWMSGQSSDQGALKLNLNTPSKVPNIE